MPGAVQETDVRHPTGFNLLGPGRLAGLPHLRDTRLAQAGLLEGQGRRPVPPSGHGAPAEVRAFLDLSLDLAGKAEGSLKALTREGCPRRGPDRIEWLAAHARRFADQTERRVLQGKAIPHAEKVFSIHGEHTRWIAKGKTGKPAELGVPVAVVDDGNGFVPGHGIMREGSGTNVTVPLVGRCQVAFPDLDGCSFDRGFHSPANRRVLNAMVEVNALPEKGRLLEAERAREAGPAFAAAHRKHAGMERRSTIRSTGA